MHTRPVVIVLALLSTAAPAFAQSVQRAPLPLPPATATAHPPAAPATTATSISAPAGTPTSSPATSPTTAPMLGLTVASAPPSLSFDAAWNGDPPQRREVTIAPVPRAGQVNAASAGSAFRVAEMLVYGEPPNSASAPAAPARPTGPRAQDRASPFASQVLKTRVTAAPFTARVEEKDRVVVVVEFAPKFSLQEVAGPKNGKLEVTGAMWKSEAPLSGFFNGLKLGLAVGRAPTFFAPGVSFTPGQRLAAWSSSPQLSVANATGEAQTVQLTLAQGPTGVELQPQSVAFSPGETKSIPLSVTWDPRKPPTGDMQLKLAYGGGKVTNATVRVEYLPPSKSFTARGDGWAATATVLPSGEVRFGGQCWLHGVAQLINDCSVYIYRNGRREGSVVLRASMTGPQNDVRSWTPQTGLTPEGVYERLQSTWSAVEVGGMGDPDVRPKVPMNPE